MKKILSTKISLFIFIILLGIAPLKAQYQNVIDSLDQHQEIERSRIFLAYVEEKKIQNEEFIYFTKIIEEYAKQKKDENLLEEIDYFRTKTKRVLDQPKENFEANFLTLIREYEQKNKPLFAAYGLHELSQFQFQNQQFAESFENSLKAKAIFKKVGYENVPSIGKFLHDLALNHYFFNDYEKVIELMQTSIKLTPHSPNLDMQRYNNIGMAYAKLNNTDSSKYYLKKSYSAAKKYNSEIWQGIATGNIGETYYKEGNYKEALKYFQEQFNLKNNDQIKTAKASSIINLGKVYLKLDSLDNTKKYLEEYERDLKSLIPAFLGDRQQIESLNRIYYQTKVDYLKRIGDYKNALSYSDSLAITDKFLTSTYNSAQTKISADKILLQQNEMKLIKEKEEKSSQQLIFFTAIFIILILGGIGFVWMHLSKLKKQRENENLQTQSKISKLEKQKAEKDLKLAKSEINRFVLKVNEQNQIVEKISSELKKIKQYQKEGDHYIDDTISQLKNVKILTDDDWISFQKNFEKLFPQIMLALKTHTPSITTSEMRYLMLIQLNFSHKEMANALGVSNDTIRVTWNRVRKKLDGTLEDTPQILIEKLLENLKNPSQSEDLQRKETRSISVN